MGAICRGEIDSARTRFLDKDRVLLEHTLASRCMIMDHVIRGVGQLNSVPANGV